MRALAQQQNRPQQRASFSLKRSGAVVPATSRQLHPILKGEENKTIHATPRLHQATTLQRHPANAARCPEVPSLVHEVLDSSSQPLDLATRGFMGSRFGHDFGQVRVHTDAKAAASAKTVHAVAYTVGQDIVFGEGQYAPYTHTGLKVLAHELTHTIQQSGGLDYRVSQAHIGVQRQEDPPKQPQELTCDEPGFDCDVPDSPPPR